MVDWSKPQTSADHLPTVAVWRIVVGCGGWCSGVAVGGIVCHWWCSGGIVVVQGNGEGRIKGRAVGG